MTHEERDLLKAYKDEVEKFWNLVQRLDSENHDVSTDFIGTPGERIERLIKLMQGDTK